MTNVKLKEIINEYVKHVEKLVKDDNIKNSYDAISKILTAASEELKAYSEICEFQILKRKRLSTLYEQVTFRIASYEYGEVVFTLYVNKIDKYVTLNINEACRNYDKDCVIKELEKLLEQAKDNDSKTRYNIANQLNQSFYPNVECFYDETAQMFCFKDKYGQTYEFLSKKSNYAKTKAPAQLGIDDTKEPVVPIVTNFDYIKHMSLQTMAESLFVPIRSIGDDGYPITKYGRLNGELCSSLQEVIKKNLEWLNEEAF